MTYYTAQICLNGHIITDTYGIPSEESEKFCSICGSVTITTCVQCANRIRGRWVTSWQSTGELRPLFNPPSFCHKCGKPYPWTEMKEKAAEEIILQIDGLSDNEKQDLVNSISDITTDTPNTEIAANKFKTAIGKVSDQAKVIFYKLIVDISSETAKKLIKGE